MLTATYLTKTYRSRGRASVHALRDVSADAAAGEIVGLVGESGSGKSTLARIWAGLETATSGTATFHRRDIADWLRRDRIGFYRRVQYVFQDPTESLNPRLTIRQQLTAPLRLLRGLSPAEAADSVGQLLAQVGLKPEHADRHPHAFSGGQAQRIAIARALAARPELVICDEAVSALDVSVQAEVLDLLRELKQSHNLAYLFITHDLAVAAEFCERLIVLKSGQIVEQGPAETLLANPKTTYTRTLRESVFTL
ncbi:MAG: ABC transporter ATP-binding protein [Verrucomicrobiota bacterium]